MYSLNQRFERLRSFLTSALFLALALSAACKQPPAQRNATTAAAAGTPVGNQPGERTADEIALIDVSIKGDTVAVKALLDRSVNANTKDPDGRTPLSEAAYYGHTEIVKLLLDHGADVFAQKTHGETVLDMAAGHQDIAAMIKREMDLLEASEKGHVQTVKDLLDKGAHANVHDPDGRTPLTESVWNNNGELVKLLLERGANPNAKKNDGATPLGIAKGKGFKEIVELLKKAGAK
jgi:ankyrin repeat protein